MKPSRSQSSGAERVTRFHIVGHLNSTIRWKRAVAAEPKPSSIRRLWNRLMDWAPTEAQIKSIEEIAIRYGRIADFWLKVAVVFAVLYLAVEIGVAFLPGGAVDRVLGGGR